MLLPSESDIGSRDMYCNLAGSGGSNMMTWIETPASAGQRICGRLHFGEVMAQMRPTSTPREASG